MWGYIRHGVEQHRHICHDRSIVRMVHIHVFGFDDFRHTEFKLGYIETQTKIIDVRALKTLGEADFIWPLKSIELRIMLVTYFRNLKESPSDYLCRLRMAHKTRPSLQLVEKSLHRTDS